MCECNKKKKSYLGGRYVSNECAPLHSQSVGKSSKWSSQLAFASCVGNWLEIAISHRLLPVPTRSTAGYPVRWVLCNHNTEQCSCGSVAKFTNVTHVQGKYAKTKKNTRKLSLSLQRFNASMVSSTALQLKRSLIFHMDKGKKKR